MEEEEEEEDDWKVCRCAVNDAADDEDGPPGLPLLGVFRGGES